MNTAVYPTDKSLNSIVHPMVKRRSYTLRARAESVEATRRAIVEAALALHEELGPLRTSISAIAERAGVQRLTVYRHFPDEVSLYRACGGLYRERHPFPDAARWRQTPPRAALEELYRHYRATAPMWSRVLRDAEESQALRVAAEPRFRFLRDARDALAAHARGPHGKAVAAHVAAFGTWRSMTGEGLTAEEAARVAADWLASG
jgi:AcrR family transcriptional regulator